MPSGITLPYEQSWDKLYKDRANDSRSRYGKLATAIMAPGNTIGTGVQALGGFGGNVLSAMFQKDKRTPAEKNAAMVAEVNDRVASGIGSSQGSTRMGVPTSAGTAPFVSFNAGPATSKSDPALPPVAVKEEVYPEYELSPEADIYGGIPNDIKAPAQQPALGTLPYDDRQELGIRGAYRDAQEGYQQRMQPALDKIAGLQAQYANAPSMGTSFGGLMANQHLMEGLGASTSALAKAHETNASGYGALAGQFMPQLNTAMSKGSANKDASELERYKSALPINKAHTALFEAQADKATKDAAKTTTKQEDKAAELNLKALKIAEESVKRDYPNGGAPYDAVSKAHEMHRQILEGNEPYEKVAAKEEVKAGALSKFVGGKDQPAVKQEIGYRKKGGASSVQSEYQSAIQRAAGDPQKIAAINARMKQLTSGGR